MSQNDEDVLENQKKGSENVRKYCETKLTSNDQARTSQQMRNCQEHQQIHQKRLKRVKCLEMHEVCIVSQLWNSTTRHEVMIQRHSDCAVTRVNVLYEMHVKNKRSHHNISIFRP